MCLTNSIVFHTIHYGINNDNTKIYHMNTPKTPSSCGRLAEAAASAGVPTGRAGAGRKVRAVPCLSWWDRHYPLVFNGI